MALTTMLERIARRVFWNEAKVLRRNIEQDYNITPTMFVQLDDGVKMPTRAHDTDAGLDLYAPHSLTVPEHSSRTIDTGVHVQLPHGTVGIIKSKSGLNVTSCLATEGVIDEGYTGSIKLRIYNHGEYPYFFNHEDMLTQLLVVPVLYPVCVEVDAIKGGERGDNGFGSTGIK